MKHLYHTYETFVSYLWYWGATPMELL